MVIFHSYVKLPEGKCISLGKSSNKFHHVTLHFCCNHFQGGSQVGKMAIVFPVFQKTIKAGPNNPLPSINCNQVQSISMCYIYIMIIIIITTIIYSSIYIYTQPNTIIIFPLENRHLSRWRLAIPSHKPGGAAGSRHIGIGEAPGLGEGDQQVVGHVVPGGTR